MDIVARGIDVSKHQGKIDWVKVKKDGINFAMIRAGWTWNDGGITIDECFTENMKNATAAGIDLGVYVYSYDHSALAAQKSAKRLLEIIKPYKLKYPVAFDMEYEAFNTTTGKGKINTDICLTFLGVIEQAGYYSMLYASKDFFENFLQLDRLVKYDKWCAQYGTKCTFGKPYGIWQYSSEGRVKGVNANVDLDYAYVDYPALTSKLGLGLANPPKPKPSGPVEKYYIKVEHFDTLEQAQAAQKKMIAEFHWYSEIKSEIV